MQGELRLIGEVKTPRDEPESLILRLPSFRASLRAAVNNAGIEQQDIANGLRLGHGDFSRMLSDARIDSRPRNIPGDLLPDFCRITNSLAPVQWLAFKLGKALIDARVLTLEEKIAELEAQNARLRDRRQA